MEIAARPAEAADLPVVVELHESAVDEAVDKRGGVMWSRRESRPPPHADHFAAAQADDACLLAVGTIDDTVVGYALVGVVALHDGATVGDLTDLFVMPEARGVGLGEAVMDLVTQWCREQGCIGIDSLALPGDRATKNFFETFGLVARALRVHRPL